MAAVIYSTRICPYCRLAKDLLKSHGIRFEEILIDEDEHAKEEMIRLSNRRTVPQIFINQQHIGGYEDLVAFIKSDEFDKLINH